MNGPQHCMVYHAALDIAVSFDNRGFIEFWDPSFEVDGETKTADGAANWAASKNS